MGAGYPEIEILEQLYGKHNISVTPVQEDYLDDDKTYPAVNLHIGNHRFVVYIDNEYSDLEKNNPLLSLCLVLRAFDAYAYAEDYLQWCTHHGLNASDEKIRDYHMSLRNTSAEVYTLLGYMECPVSDFDFELNAGAAQHLRAQ